MLRSLDSVVIFDLFPYTYGIQTHPSSVLLLRPPSVLRLLRFTLAFGGKTSIIAAIDGIIVDFVRV